MEFFSKLADIGNVDISMRIMQKNDKLTIEWMPGSAKATGVKPLLTTGTGAELDGDFFERILPKVNEIKGLISNLDEVNGEADKAVKEEASKPADAKPAGSPKKGKPAAATKKSVPAKKTAKKKAAVADKPKQRVSEQIMEEAEAIESADQPESAPPVEPTPAPAPEPVPAPKPPAIEQPDLFSSGLLK